MLLGALLVSPGSIPAFASQALYVDDDACPAPGSGTPTSPYCRIQDAICALRTTGGGTVYVRPGVYHEALTMFAGTSVVATDGPEVTTIDAGGKPCITSACLVDATRATCSAVTFHDVNGVGATPADRLVGFRITGGAGTLRSFSDGTPFLAGGGIYIRNSSPTITENQIVGNALGGSGGARLYYGGGIYVHAADGTAPARPVITVNLIEGNVADPPNGSAANPSRASGAGIYAGYYSAPSITGNLVQDNVAGSAQASNQQSAGGGLAVYSIVPGAVISRNVIESNFAALRGGGLSLGSVSDATTYAEYPSLVSVDSNLIAYNSSALGGGMSGATTRAQLRSNTFYDNEASENGAAGYLETSANPGDQATFVNDIFAFNVADANGGALFVSGANPIVRFCDLFGNLPDNVSGTHSDSDYVGLNGNVSVDPGFVDRNQATLDLSLRATSPLLDVGSDAAAPALDLESAPRVQDGNHDAIARIDLGAYEWGDLDGDGIADGQDPDLDGDAVADVQDCAPRTLAVSAAAGMIEATLRLEKSGGVTSLRWSRGLQGHVSNVYRGSASQPWTYDETCFDSENPDTRTSDAQNPPQGGFFYYFVSAKNLCGESAEDRDRQGASLLPARACPDQNRDTDGDAVPDVEDGCPGIANQSQADGDHDWVGDACDNCPQTSNPNQADGDQDGTGDACDCNPSDPGTTRCDDHNPCTDDVCQSGACAHTNNAAACSDADPCTLGDRCTGGACVGTPRDCSLLTDACNTGVCELPGGNCSAHPLANGNPCNDGNACTLTDACRSGVCEGNDPVACTPSDGCHLAGACNSVTGACSNPAAPDGSACDDGDACTTNDACGAATCQGIPRPPPGDMDTGLRVSRNGLSTTINWNAAPGATSSDVLRGLVRSLPVGPGGEEELCLAQDLVGGTAADAALPTSGDAFWYVVRGKNACGNGPYGSAGLHGAASSPRSSTTCP